MTCFKPIIAWYSKDFNHNGKRYLVFNRNNALDPRQSITVPCGQCIGCRLEKSRQWAIRCVCEQQMSDESCFITLTYDDDHLPRSCSLVPDDLQKFFKRLRRYLEYHNEMSIRFFACGEYGEQFQRPHYHAIIFGWYPSDVKPIGFSPAACTGSNGYYISECLTSLWPFGYHIVTGVSFESCAYVARYVTKKITGPGSDEYYDGRVPEFVRMSRRPGIGNSWLEKYHKDVYPNDFVIIRNGIKCRPPKYFDSIYEKMDFDSMLHVKQLRKDNGYAQMDNDAALRNIDFGIAVSGSDFMSYNDFKRDVYNFEVLPVKEECQNAKVSRLKRSYEQL